ncbi:FAD-dependent monooxygenase [Bradyrhizobium sp. U87765 SZCCT0131]|uniref:FAD-dependent oxidoreductase n=1 Tax=unclassified Bradyrhizobium TaxID=2631580 RepID=UPI001BA4AA75|nr:MULTISPECIES: FAD-dependent monooxygenase [unclassified Bradyrhizobium]MBR1222794.1 FAD-dependent monooxygenase [Bradyrhizobium sp. U87765 SZCCT0131]MBR1265125.1 FAD-dependent monooxygenase [Bradyrhizobium sp. U87765 SZCCT0134]MBR1303096.1 FAD-dependent monooxygenase [Bradyrhizobium sp. U87765 SZCCT0110]MBR1318702.1 FAD-dependent monooxygenase [Bradyrhizobium sp. U87765 SZCCT0109]MBR1347025.1 FAD-dependent monooxygenase [Bradyrhizobium sp. U87765 SZCCT0048]
MSSAKHPVIVAGAGPVGMVAAASLVRQGIPVLVLEKSGDLSRESRASTFHPPTLDMLDDLGFAQALIAQGLKAPTVQYSSTADGLLGTFDFSAISDLTRHPFRLQAEQFKLTRIVLEALRDNPLFAIEFECEVTGIAQTADGVKMTATQAGLEVVFECDWLIGADGANSIVRRAQDIPFEGFTWPERFLVMTTPVDFTALRPGVSSVSYVADPERWHFLLRIIGAWRVMMPVPNDMSDETALSPAYVEESIRRVVPPQIDAAIQHTTLYRVHQRVATSFQKGRTFLVGDAAHINNPLGGMGMNGGIHDALNLTGKLGPVINGSADASLLADYDLQRRTVTMQAIQGDTIRNKRNLEAKDEADRARFRDEIRAAAADGEKGRQLLRRIAMLDSLARAASLHAA